MTVINAAGSNYVYSTFLGGADNDEGLGIAVDSAGDAYVTGMTDSSLTFPIKSAYQSTYGGGLNDAFVTELNPWRDCSDLLDIPRRQFSRHRHRYCAGWKQSCPLHHRADRIFIFPLASATQGTLGGDNDAFVSELGSTGSTLLFSTYLGGSLNRDTTSSGNEPLSAVAVSGPGANIYVTGNTACH